MHKDRRLSFTLIVLAGFLFCLPLYWGLIKDLSDLLTQIVSGAILVILAAAVGLWIRGGSKKSESAQREVTPDNVSSVDTTKHQDAILANIVQTISNLNLRYSRGEITREEYLKAKSDLQTEGKSVSFEAGILKSSYRQHESVRLWAKYTGTLYKGYHVIQVSSTSGATIPEGRDWWSDPTTYHNPNGSGRVGRLIVPPPYEYKGSQSLADFPIGEYKIVFEIGEGKLSDGNRLARQEAFFVVESEAHPTQYSVTSREKEDFRNGVATEVQFILKMFIDPLHHWNISYPSWCSKAEQSKAAILGKEDYLVAISVRCNRGA